MSLDPPTYPLNFSGSIEVICGSMYSGKTEELLRRIKRANYAKQTIEVYKPIIDNRYDNKNVVSHNANSINATAIKKASDIFHLTKNPNVIGIDEVQFFNNDIIEVCTKLANNGVRVILSGLDMDYLGKPYGPMPTLLSIAESITKLHAICFRCSKLANHTHRTTKEKKLISVGEKEKYIALCRTCYNKNLSNA